MPSGNIAEVHCSQISAAANELLEVRNQRRVSLVQTSLVSQPLAVIPEVRPLAGDLLAAELHGAWWQQGIFGQAPAYADMDKLYRKHNGF